MGGGGAAPTPPASENFSGGYFEHGGDKRRRTKREIQLERARYGISLEAQGVIAEVAERQVDRLEADPQKRFEELERELELKHIGWRAEYLRALNAERERLITGEIAARLQAKQADDEAIILGLLAAAI